MGSWIILQGIYNRYEPKYCNIDNNFSEITLLTPTTTMPGMTMVMMMMTMFIMIICKPWGQVPK